MIKAVIFLRVSTNHQTLEQQQTAMMEIALKDFKKSEIAIVEGKESATKLDRDQRQTLRNLYLAIDENPTIKRVYFYAVDRLSRKASMVSVIADELAEKGIDCYFHNPFQLHTLTPDGKRNPIADMMLYFLGKGAEMETELRVQRVEDKRKEMLVNDQIATGKVLYGYTRAETKKAVINEDTAQYVRMMFNMYASGEHSLSTIGSKMFELGVFTSNKVSRKTERARSILTNLAYSGRQGAKTKYTYPPIVSPELQDKVIAMMKENKAGEKKSTSTIYYAKGLLFSKYTEHAMCLHRPANGYKTAKDDELKMFLGLNAAEYIIYCNMAFHLPMFNAIQSQKNKQQYKDAIARNDNAIERLKTQKEKLDAEFKRMYNAYKKGLTPIDVYEDDVKENRKQIAKLDSDIARLMSENANFSQYLNADGSDTPVIHVNEVKGEMDDALIRDLTHKMFKRVLVSKMDNGHTLIEFETIEPLPNFGNVFEYWSRGGYPHLIKHREGFPSIDITGSMFKRFEMHRNRKKN